MSKFHVTSNFLRGFFCKIKASTWRRRRSCCCRRCAAAATAVLLPSCCQAAAAAAKLPAAAKYSRYLSTTNACSCYFLKYARFFLKSASKIQDVFVRWHPHQLLLSCGAPYKFTLLTSRNSSLVTRLSKFDIKYSLGHTLPSFMHGYMRACFHICIGGCSSIIRGLFFHRSV